MKYLDENSRIWDSRAEANDIWSQPVSSEEINFARIGMWNIVLTPQKLVPRDWLPKELSGKKILCLACGGGQQAPILPAAGAEVTVLDNSKNNWKETVSSHKEII